HHVFRAGEADQRAHAGVGGRVTGGGAHAAAHSHIEALQFAVFDDGHQAQVVGKDIAVVVRRDGHADLELARQVGRVVAVDRLVVYRFAHLFAAQPDFGI